MSQKLEKCPHCQALRDPADFISKNGQRKVKCCKKCRESSARYTKKYQFWTDQQVQELRTLAPTMTGAQLAKHFKRSVSSVRKALSLHGIDCIKTVNGQVVEPTEEPGISASQLISMKWVA